MDKVAIADICKDFKLYYLSGEEIKTFPLGKYIWFVPERKRLRVYTKQPSIHTEEVLDLSSDAPLSFSPKSEHLSIWEKIFEYYLYTEILSSLPENDCRLFIVIPQFASYPYQKMIKTILERTKKDVLIVREVEPFLLHYLFAGMDSYELEIAAENEDDIHIYGLLTTGEGINIVFVKYLSGERLIIEELEGRDSVEKAITQLELMVAENSSNKENIYLFSQSKEVLEWLITKREFEGKEGGKIGIRLLRTQSSVAEQLVTGLRYSDKLPTYMVKIGFQNQGVGYIGLEPIEVPSNFKLRVNFEIIADPDFYINLFLGPGLKENSVFLLKRLFLNLKGVGKKQLSFDVDVSEIEEGFKIILHEQRVKKRFQFYVELPERVQLRRES